MLDRPGFKPWHALVPLAAFVLQRLVLAAAARVAGFDPLAPSSWSRWDSVYYLDVAAHGYAPIQPCSPESHYPATAWCGNAGWFPGFSWTVRLLARAGLPLEGSALAVCAAAQLACLFLIWRCLDDERQWPALGVAAFFPGNVYMAAIFPTSLFLLFTLACLAACGSRRFLPAAIAGALAATCHPMGVLLAPVILAWAMARRIRAAAWVALAVLFGYALVLLVLRLEAGAWDAYFRTQAKYGYGVGFGIDTLLAHLKPLVNPRYRTAKGVVTAMQTLLCTVMVAGLAYRWRSHLSSDRNALLAITVGAFWIAPLLLGGNLSLYRAEALLLPAALLLPVLSRAFQLGLLAGAIAISVPMATLFLQSVLV